MDVPGITVDPGFGCVMSAVSEFQALLEDVCQGGFVNISEKGEISVAVNLSHAGLRFVSQVKQL